MPNSELMSIGAFARRSGLTPSALRFYADSGLLAPAEIDPVSGYRYYSGDQVARASVLRRLREIGMPLAAVGAVLGAGAGEAARLVDEHVARVVGDAAVAQQKAAVIKSVLGAVPPSPVAVLKGPVLADAVEQVLTAAVHEPGMPVLAGLRIEASDEAVTLTATDRYRLSTRTLVPAEPPRQTWAGTVSGDELRVAVAEIRRSALVRLEAGRHGIRFRVAAGEDRYCRLLSEEFPDYRLVLTSLGEVTTRVTVAKEPLLRALEEHPGERIGLRVAEGGADVVSADDEDPGIRLPATASGRPLRVWFELTTLYPAVSTAIGPDVMLDLRGEDQPVTIRSADRGDLTTLAMPVKSDHSV
ncbi:MerR family transcriptional regulator [Streptomyces subrutilus]|uniref:Transcriptional regulator n=1 Tax=Streptomyces subrutilus TaxID=36818 RepID=A0A1E5PTR4_9ACTN|nr:MerR family transcriptional regulator [Streptomyces subrutilus]OEJ32966.1 transcriptional regulator [Streptomyces subrutilus]